MTQHLFALAAAAAMTAAALPAHAALANGDVAFTAFNADEDGFALVSFVDIAAGTTVYFSDNEYVSGAFNTGESYSRWTTGTVTAGDVIRFSKVDTLSLAASNGTLARQTVSGSANWGLSASNETLYAYVGSSAATPITFLAAITNGTFAADGSLAGTGLSLGSSNAIQLTSKAGAAAATPDFAEYNGSRGPFAGAAAAKLAVADLGNWTVDTTNGVYATTVPNTTAFTISAVPEPESYALMLAGLAAVGFVARRRG